MTLNSNDGDESGANRTASFVPLIVPSAKLSYRLNECYINSSHHTESLLPLGFVFVYPVCKEGSVPDSLFNWHGRVPKDGWVAGWVTRDCLSLSVSESMAAICQFQGLFSAPGVSAYSRCCVLTLLLSGVFVHRSYCCLYTPEVLSNLKALQTQILQEGTVEL